MNVVQVGVGRNFPLKRKEIGDGIRVEYTSFGPFIALYFSEPTSEEIKMIANEAVEIRLASADEILFFVFHFGDNNWMDASFNARIYDAEFDLRNLGNRPENLYIYLVDAMTNIIKAMRIIELDEHFSTCLWELIQDQYKVPFNFETYAAKLNRIYSSYTSSQIADCTNLGLKIDSNKGICASKPNDFEILWYE